MTRSQDTRLLFRPSPTQRHCTICRWVTRLGKGEVRDEGQVLVDLDFVDWLALGEESLCETELPWDWWIISRKESLGEVGLRLVIPVWLTGQGREGLTIWSRGGATHLSSARKTWQVTAIVIIITMIANKIIGKATKEPFKRDRSTEEKQRMCPAMQCDHILKMSDWIANKFRC